MPIVAGKGEGGEWVVARVRRMFAVICVVGRSLVDLDFPNLGVRLVAGLSSAMNVNSRVCGGIRQVQAGSP